MTVATRSAGPMLRAAAFALVNDSAQFARPATSDETQHFTMSQGNSIAKLFQISRRMLSQTISNAGHRWLVVLLAPKDCFDHLAGIGRSSFGQMQVNHGRLQAAVAQILLDDFERDARFEQVRCV